MSWADVVKEANDRAAADPFVQVILHQYILDHDSFGKAIIHSLSLQFDGLIKAKNWEKLFHSVVNESTLYNEGMGTIEEMGLKDLAAISDRDPASDGLVNPFLYFKGFKAIQAHRIAHALWLSGRKDSARAIQSRCSEIYAVDIHPGAIIGIFYFS